MSSSVLQLQQDMCNAIAKTNCRVEDQVHAKVCEVDYTIEDMLRDYITLMAVAKRRGYNGFSDEVSAMFMAMQADQKKKLQDETPKG